MFSAITNIILAYPQPVLRVPITGWEALTNRIVVGKLEEKGPLGRPVGLWKILKWILDVMGLYGLD
jgi:hypothetical protein